MKKGKYKLLLVTYLKKYIPMLLSNKKLLEEVSTHLYTNHNVPKGQLMYMLSDENVLVDQDISLLGLLTEQMSIKVEQSKDDLQVDKWLTDYEIVTMRKYLYIDESKTDELKLPLILDNAMDLGDGVYAVAVPNTLIARMRKYHLLTYNFDIQREAKLIKIGGEVVRQMNLNHYNIKEMTNLILENKLKKTAIAYNCAVDTTSDDSGMELVYDSTERTLTITEGTQIDILDGTHRSISFYEAYKKNPNINGSTIVHFSNYTPKQASEYQVQLSKQTPIPKARIKQLDEGTLSSTLVNRLGSEGYLRDKITVGNVIGTGQNEFIHYNNLVNGFEQYWTPENHRDITNIMKQFNEYLEYFSEVKEYIPTHFINDKKLFISNIVIAKEMLNRKVPFTLLKYLLEFMHNEHNSSILYSIKDKMRKSGNSKLPYKELSDYLKKLIDKWEESK